jgi:hypothetical protein
MEMFYYAKKEVNHMKKIFTFIVAAVIAISFSVVGFAQDKPAPGADQPKAGTVQPEKKAEKKHKKHKKHHKKHKKTKEAAPSTEAAPAK